MRLGLSGFPDACYHRAPLTPRCTRQGETPVKHVAFCFLMLCGTATLALAQQAAPTDAKPAVITPAAPTDAKAAAPVEAKPAGQTDAKPVAPASPKPAAPKPAAAPGAKTTATKPAEVDSLVLLEKAVARDSSKIDNLYKL